MINRQQFQQYLAQTSDAPLALEFSRAEGVWLYDPKDKPYLDLISGISVSSCGHSHPHIVQAVQKQAAAFMHLMVYGEYVQSPQVRYAEKLIELLPVRFDRVYFTNSGAEATEGALKLARRATGRSEIIYTKGAYHGSTSGALSVMGDEYYRRNYRPLIPGNRMIRYNEIDDLEHINSDTAAVIMETVQAETGVTVPSENYMKALRNKCNEVGCLLILDEAQAGLGRTGSWFAFQQFDIEPDILLLAKAVGGGMPLGAFIASNEIMENLQDNPVLGHITTFGGHPVSCAAGLASVEVMENEQLLDRVPEIEKSFVERLQHPAIRQLNHKGCLIALQFDSFEHNKAIIDHCIHNGVITDWFLYNPSALRIAPPLVISEKEIELACQTINTAIGTVLG